MDANNVAFNNDNLEILKDENEVELTIPEYILIIREDVKSNDFDSSNFEKYIELIIDKNKINYDELPINVWEIARKMNFKVLEATFSGKMQNVNSLMYNGKKPPEFLKQIKSKRAIIINKDENSKEQAFSIAYQIVAFVFYFDSNLNQVSLLRNANVKKENSNPKLSNALKIATMLLMPKNKVIDEVNILRSLDDKDIIMNILSDRFMIPLDHVEERLSDLDLLSTLVGGDNNG